MNAATLQAVSNEARQLVMVHGTHLAEGYARGWANTWAQAASVAVQHAGLKDARDRATYWRCVVKEIQEMEFRDDPARAS